MSLAFCPVLDELYRTNSATDAEGIRRDVHGLSTPNNIVIIRNLMMALKPARTIEVGLAAGGSALAFAASHRDLGQAPAHQHTAVDPYQRLWHHIGKALLTRAGLDPYSRVLEDWSCLALPALMRDHQTFQFAYIDGSHAFHEAMIDFYYMRYLLDVGGVVLLDDCATPDVRRLVTFIRRRIVSFKEFDLTTHQTNSWKRRIAKALNRSQCVAFQKIAHPSEDEKHTY